MKVEELWAAAPYGKWCYLEREWGGGGGVEEKRVKLRKRERFLTIHNTAENSAFWLLAASYSPPETQGAPSEERRNRRRRLGSSIHFTAISVWRAEDGAQFSTPTTSPSSPGSRSSALTRSQFAKWAAGAVGETLPSHGPRRFHNKPRLLAAHPGRFPLLRRALLWGILPSRRKKRNLCFKFSPGSCTTIERKRKRKKKPHRRNMGICGCLAMPGKCLVVLGLKLLFLVPAGVPARSGDSVLKDNITVRQGDSAVLK